MKSMIIFAIMMLTGSATLYAYTNGVFGDNIKELEIDEGLTKNRFYGLRKEILSIENRESNADAGSSRLCHNSSRV